MRTKHLLRKGGDSFVDLFYIYNVICVSLLSVIMSCLFRSALWLQAGKWLTSQLSLCDVLLCFYHFPIWCSRSGVVFNCIDS